MARRKDRTLKADVIMNTAVARIFHSESRMPVTECSPRMASVSDIAGSRGNPHRRVVALHQYQEIVYWTIVLGVSEATLYAAVAEVGNCRDAINTWLETNR